VTTDSGNTFFALTPERVLDAVEVGGLRSTGRCLPLRRLREPRVRGGAGGREPPRREVLIARPLVARDHPGRATSFLADLAEAEVPAVAPMDLGKGTTLNEIEGIYYAAFRASRGRRLDELGRRAPAPHRPHAAACTPSSPALPAKRPTHFYYPNYH
jgi:hypothetical protein